MSLCGGRSADKAKDGTEPMNRIADARMVGLTARKNAIYPEQRMQAEQFLKNLEGLADSSTSPATH